MYSKNRGSQLKDSNFKFVSPQDTPKVEHKNLNNFVIVKSNIRI